MPSTTPSSRSDATRNRSRILDVARECFDEFGVDVPMDTVAKRAGVGAGTLYRHFPNRDALITALVTASVGDLERIHHELEITDADPATKLEAWLGAMREWTTSYDGLPEPLRNAWEEDATPLGANCGNVISLTEGFLHDAQQHGSARPELTARDLYLANLGAAWASCAPLADSTTSNTVATLLNNGWRTR